jgi:DNA-binding response OmpR family regulator
MAGQANTEFNTFIFNNGLDRILTRSELRCLKALFDKQNHLVDRDNLANHLWGENWPEKYSDWALSHVICRLRKKTEHLTSLSIKTRRDLGFVLEIC